MFPHPEGVHAAFIKFASLSQGLIGIADVIGRRDLPTRKLGTVPAALRSQPVNALQAAVAYPGADLFLRPCPLPGQRLGAAILI